MLDTFLLLSFAMHCKEYHRIIAVANKKKKKNTKRLDSFNMCYTNILHNVSLFALYEFSIAAAAAIYFVVH